MNDTVARYVACWNETDADARRALIAEVFTEDVTYTDPLVAVRGHDGLDAVIAGVHRQFPGFVLTLDGAVDAHHDQARFTWTLGPRGAAEAPVAGFDVAVADPDGRISTVLGFLDRVPG